MQKKQQEQKASGLAIAALILGLFGLIPVIGITPGVIGIVFGSIVLKKKGGGRGFAIAGIIMGVLGLLLSVAIVAFFLMVASKAADDPAAIFL